ncbi:ATP-binding cassette domain-containing protein [Allorhizocola rhizosphaerae]|uniref:ATP-binding cassette domain-containing protein n=1 Tax=Allorhizocola rhizosphaerae TaxID=1872709 RepID=UPI0013C308C0|nr:ATP-binding cassette domain-containing protein [Allorhizocola rhizosphaerae]
MDIHTSDLTVDFAHRRLRAVDGLSLRIAAGEHVALLGPSGAGKSTLLRALLGAVCATGSVRVGGMDPYSAAQRRAVRRATGVIRQGGDLVPGLTARTNAFMGSSPEWTVRDWLTVLCGRVPSRYAVRLGTLAERHGVAESLSAPVRELSGGQRQRVALIRALLPGPRLILADEPTSGLDPVNAAAAVDALCALPGSVTVIVATHDLAVAGRFPRILALRDGRLAHDGATIGAEIYT